MGLMVCENNIANRPLYIEELSLNIYSMEELCFIIYEHPLLVSENFVNERLFDFIKNELNLSGLAWQLEKMKLDRISDDNIVVFILENSKLYRSYETSRYKSTLSGYRRLKKAELLKEKADYMFRLRRYGKSIRYYKAVVKLPMERGSRDKLIGRSYQNMACAYANLYMYKEAYFAFRQAYNHLLDKNILKKIYFLSLCDKNEENKKIYETSINEDMKAAWRREFNKISDEVESSEKVLEIKEDFARNDLNLYKRINEQLNKWKNEYRGMI